MRQHLHIRNLLPGEQEQLQNALKSNSAFTLRRAQYLLASEQGLKPLQIATTYGGSQQNVRNVIKAFNAEGLEALTPKSRRPKSVKPLLEGQNLQRLEHLLHQSPRLWGKNTSLWTQHLIAQVAFEEGLTPEVVSHETIRQALRRLGANWKRAKDWITSPDPQYELKKSGASALLP